jgi:hypothetical protein
MTKRIQRYTVQAFSLILLVFAVRNWIKTTRELLRFYTNMPIWDPWDYLTHYARYKRLDFSVLWIQHNEHREIGTELLYAIDMLKFHERQILPTLAGIAAYVGALVVFVTFAFYGAADKRATRCAALLVAVLAGYKICAVSLTIPFLLSWPQWEFFGVATLGAAVLHKKQGGQMMLCAAILFAITATYSMSNGMFVWPVLLAVAFLSRYRWKELILIVIVGTITVGLYFYHYKNLHTFGLAAFFGHPGYAVEFLGSFLGMPFSAAFGLSHPILACGCGWLALLVMAADLAGILYRRLFHEPAVLVLGGYCTLTLISAALTAIGRMNPEDPYYLASRAGRYVTEPTLFWCALVMLTVWLIDGAWEGYGALTFMTAVAVFAAVTLPKTVDYYAWWEAYFQRGQWAAIAIENGVVDNDVSDILFPNRDYVKENMHVLIDRHLAGFADAKPGWIGRQASELFSRGPDGWIHGKVTTVKRRGTDYEVQGWSDGAVTVVFVDNTGRIVGFGVRPNAGPMELYTHLVPRSMTFTGFIRGEFGEREFSTWALDRKQKMMSRMGQLRNELPQ